MFCVLFKLDYNSYAWDFSKHLLSDFSTQNKVITKLFN